ncbi:MAG: hypothetical protein AUI47_03845 [Acidobacteria bacterium 13_1_40CM_2_68_5]|nr:MAG: hypothetical protein AUI47_03845 [Acidobacteria bacterium 13_1_40CM_2_68_5]
MMKEASSMTPKQDPGRAGEQGSALIIATLVSVILALLGLSYLMMAQTESTIAENERNSATAMYVAEAGTRLAVNWFNDPSSTGYLVPTSAQVDRTLRVFDHDANPGTARVQAVAGDCTRPLYKDAVCTTSPILDRPYRSDLANTYIGVETGFDGAFPNAGPDLVVSAAHLATINAALFPNFPKVDLRARITRIEIYAPPSATIGGTTTRLGIATVKVTSGLFIYPGSADERQVATRVVKAVINEIPVPGPVGPLQSCADLSYTGSFEIHWGTGSALAGANIPGNLDNKVPSSIPYALNDPGTYYTDATPHNLATWAADPAITGAAVEDPWFKFIAGGTIAGMPNSNPQPYPMTFPGGTYPYPGNGTSYHTNVFQNTVINCPAFDYNLWKSIAQGGNRGNYYYSWSSADQFQQDGAGTPVTMGAATTGKSGIFFFDTRDGLPPRGLYTDAWPTTNLTPGISYSSSDWNGMQGFTYLNTATFQTTGAGSIGITRTIFPPGEPQDASGFVNLQYPGTLTGTYTVRGNGVTGTAAPASFVDPATGNRYCVDAATCTTASWTASATPVRDDTGLPFQTDVVLDGVMYNSGTFTASGNAVYFGSFVAQQGVLDGAGNPAFYFDESLVKGNWPRKGMNMPRVIVSSWQTGL